MERKKILFLCPQPFFQWRGSPIRVDFTLKALTEAGYEVDLLVLPGGEDREMPGLKIFRMPNFIGVKKIPIGPSFPKLFFDGVMLVYGFRRIIGQRYEGIHGIEEGAILAAILGFIGRKPFLMEKHSDTESYSKKGLMSLVLKFFKGMEKWAARRAAIRIGTGPGLVDQLKAFSGGKSSRLISDIPSSLKLAEEEGISAWKHRLGIGGDKVFALYVGSFATYQGLALLFEALPDALDQNENLYLIIVGGSEKEISSRKSTLAARHSERVLFLGTLAPDELPSLFGACEILLSPRIAGMNTPLKLLDYLKAGRAILATDHPSNRLILNEEVAHLVTPEKTALVAGFTKLVRDPVYRAKLSKMQSELLRERYSYEVFKSELLQAYEEFLLIKSKVAQK